MPGWAESNLTTGRRGRSATRAVTPGSLPGGPDPDPLVPVPCAKASHRVSPRPRAFGAPGRVWVDGGRAQEAAFPLKRERPHCNPRPNASGRLSAATRLGVGQRGASDTTACRPAGIAGSAASDQTNRHSPAGYRRPGCTRGQPSRILRVAAASGGHDSAAARR